MTSNSTQIHPFPTKYYKCNSSEFSKKQRRNQVCKYYTTPRGCVKGENCEFLHVYTNKNKLRPPHSSSIPQSTFHKIKSNDEHISILPRTSTSSANSNLSRATSTSEERNYKNVHPQPKIKKCRYGRSCKNPKCFFRHPYDIVESCNGKLEQHLFVNPYSNIVTSKQQIGTNISHANVDTSENITNSNFNLKNSFNQVNTSLSDENRRTDGIISSQNILETKMYEELYSESFPNIMDPLDESRYVDDIASNNKNIPSLDILYENHQYYHKPQSMETNSSLDFSFKSNARKKSKCDLGPMCAYSSHLSRLNFQYLVDEHRDRLGKFSDMDSGNDRFDFENIKAIESRNTTGKFSINELYTKNNQNPDRKFVTDSDSDAKLLNIRYPRTKDKWRNRTKPNCRYGSKCRKKKCKFMHPHESFPLRLHTSISSSTLFGKEDGSILKPGSTNQSCLITDSSDVDENTRHINENKVQILYDDQRLKGENISSVLKEIIDRKCRERGKKGLCRYGSKCYEKNCSWEHPSPRNKSQSRRLDICKYGSKCENKDCTKTHLIKLESPVNLKSVFIHRNCCNDMTCSLSECNTRTTNSTVSPSML